MLKLKLTVKIQDTTGAGLHTSGSWSDHLDPRDLAEDQDIGDCLAEMLRRGASELTEEIVEGAGSILSGALRRSVAPKDPAQTTFADAVGDMLTEAGIEHTRNVTLSGRKGSRKAAQ